LWTCRRRGGQFESGTRKRHGTYSVIHELSIELPVRAIPIRGELSPVSTSQTPHRITCSHTTTHRPSPINRLLPVLEPRIESPCDLPRACQVVEGPENEVATPLVSSRDEEDEEFGGHFASDDVGRGEGRCDGRHRRIVIDGVVGPGRVVEERFEALDDLRLESPVERVAELVMRLDTIELVQCTSEHSLSPEGNKVVQESAKEQFRQ
jgi:hypothetical protein